MEPEELKKRRVQRQQSRMEKQKKRRRKTLWILLLLVLLALGGGGLYLWLGNRSPEAPPVQTTAATSGPEETLPPTSTIHLAFGGDLTVTDSTVGSGGMDFLYEETFRDVAPLLADADIAALNFEGVLCGSPWGTQSRSAPQSMADALSKAGVDLIQLANSYSIYNGTSGLAQTIDSVRAAGMEPLGVYPDQAAAKEGRGYTILEAQGVRVAFVAFTKGMDGMTLPAGSEGCVNLLYTDYDSTYQKVNTEGIVGILNAAKEEKPDTIVAMLHWGSEFNDTISKSQEKIVKLLQDNGVDTIVGTHSHYVQKVDFDRENGRLVAYSLGDFFGDAQRAGSEYSIILNVEITRNNETGETRVTDFAYTPIFNAPDQSGFPRVVRIQEAMGAYENRYLESVSKDTYERMEYAMERIEARVSGE